MGAQAPQEGQGASREGLLPEGRRGRPFPRKESKGMKGQGIPAMGERGGQGAVAGEWEGVRQSREPAQAGLWMTSGGLEQSRDTTCHPLSDRP